MYRQQIKQIKKDLQKKMVFIVGPRQVGKTWLAKEIGKDYENTTYLNFDRFEDREIIKNEAWTRKTELLILDELHKMPEWKNYLKGVYDTKENDLDILVTGSARLDTFRQAGDSLAGRFFVHHLLPFSISELKGKKEGEDINRFIIRGGFPEPFLSDSETDAARWRAQYIDGLVRRDILDFERIHDLRAAQTVFELLRRRVGSPISYNSIARDVQISPMTVKRYIEIFEALYIIFRVFPYSRNIARSILKEPKIYFYDTGLVEDEEGVKFENMTAVSFLKSQVGKTDNIGVRNELKYLRTKNGQEVDFALVKKDKIEKIIEVKLSDSQLSKDLKYFTQKYDLPGIQIVKNLKREKSLGRVNVFRADNFLKGLFM
ncbi:ATP-binding protein [Candidatus Parcubacteria bacterium]|nr:ATP-binding protein [Candidatus Parcubacteria bacterium]